MSDDEKKALVRSPSTALTHASSNSLATRGLLDVEASEQAEAGRTLLVPPAGRRHGVIFVVDDEESVRQIICSILASEGYECQDFAGGTEALAALESGVECGVLLTDMLNAPMDGFTLLQRVREQFPTIPVVISTAIRDDDLARACIHNGAYDYLLLPYERRQLLDVIHRVMEDPHGPG